MREASIKNVKKALVVVLSAFAIVITTALVKPFPEKQNGMSLEAYLQKVSTKEKVVFVYFHADWCVPCVKLKPGITELEKEVLSFCEVLRMDVDENPTVALHFEINTLPMFMIYKNGKCVWKHTGFLSKPELSGKLSIYNK